MCLYIHTKFEVSSVTLTSFGQGVILPYPYPPTAKQTPEHPPTLKIQNC